MPLGAGGFGYGRRWELTGHQDAEGFGEGAENAGGPGDFGEKAGAFFGFEEVFELAGETAGVVVVDVADQPGLPLGKGWGGAGMGGARGAVALFGEGVVAPVCDEFFPAPDRAGEVVVDLGEERFAVGGFAYETPDDGLDTGEDGAEGGGEDAHARNYI